MTTFLFSKEFSFSILLLSGTIKMLLPLIGVNGIPDLTLLSAFLVTIIMINHMRTSLKSLSQNRVEAIFLITLFYLFIIYSLSYTSSSSACIIKTINFGTMALAFYFPLFVNEFNIKRFIRAITLFIFICSVIFLNFYTSYLNRDEAMILNMGDEEAIQMTALYLTISWLNGILVLYYFFQKDEVSWIRWSILLVALIFLISAGGRGPLLFAVAILGLYFSYQLLISFITLKLNRLMLPLLIMILSISTTIFIVSNVEMAKYHPSLKLVDNTVMRLMGLVNEEGGGASAHSRIVNAKFSIDKINKKSFWGYGIGSYGYEMTRVDYLDYPHNIILEVWFELGYLALIIFLLLFYHVYRQISYIECSWCLALYTYFLLNVLKSSSLIDIRMMLAFYAIFLSINLLKVNI